MPKFSTWFGAVLVVFGLVAYFGTGGDSLTALIPCLFGISFGMLGAVALNQKYKKNAMIGALLLAIVGALSTFGGLVDLFSEATPEAISKSIMSGLCIIYIIPGVKSMFEES